MALAISASQCFDRRFFSFLTVLATERTLSNFLAFQQHEIEKPNRIDFAQVYFLWVTSNGRRVPCMRLRSQPF